MDERDIRQAARLLAGAGRAVALTGAGASTPSGIPDFRSPSSGLWERADPMRVASIWGFRADPQAFYDWIFGLAHLVRAAGPNPAHIALADLESLGKLRAVITQNIDGLHQAAGSRRVLELHGHLREMVCLACARRTPAEGIWERAMLERAVPRCAGCAGPLKPAVVLFGELLPRDVLFEARHESVEAHVVLVAGSSLEVAPASDLPLLARRAGARLIIVNFQPTPLDELADVVIRDDVARVLPAIVEEVRAHVAAQ